MSIKQNDVVIILGMHRSGTSCLTGSLKNFGLHLGNVSQSNKHNLKGNQENRAIHQLNEELLKHNNGSWRRPPEDKLVWNKKLEDKRDLVLSEYQNLPKPWGIKDPRMLLAYPFWENQLPEHALIGTYRHPLAVIDSLGKRKHPKLYVDFDSACRMWQVYNEKLIAMHINNKFPIISFDVSSSQYLKKLDKIRQTLNLKTQERDDFFDSGLRSESGYTRSSCPAPLLSLYDQLNDVSI